MDYPLKDVAQFACYDGKAEGLIITCPNCGVAMSAWFDVPIGGGEPQFPKTTRWKRTGETLETLTLNPSFLAYDHYHSWIRDGKLCVDSPFSCDKDRSEKEKQLRDDILAGRT